MMASKIEEDCWESLSKPIQVAAIRSFVRLDVTLQKKSVSVNEAQDLAGVFIEESIRRSPRTLKATAKYCFEDQTLVLCFWSSSHNWSLVAITGFYDFTREEIDETAFEESVENELGATPFGDDVKLRAFSIDFSKIDRHCFKKDFTFKVSFTCDGDNEAVYSGTYAVTVPFAQKHKPMIFNTIADYHSPNEIVNLYNAKFTTNQNLAKKEQQMLADIANHKTDDPLKAIEMLKIALSIEDLSSQEEYRQFNQTDVTFKCEDGYSRNHTRYSMSFPRHKLPLDFDELHVCIVPMERYVAGKFNYEDDSVFAQVIEHKNDRLQVKCFPTKDRCRTPINCELKYSVRFMQSRKTYRAGFQALDKIHDCGLDAFFSDFEVPPKMYKQSAVSQHEDFEWFNEQIAANEEQKLAIKNIVNCTAFPFPYVVFGPPGTGKTSCLVEAIAQILKLKPDSRILVTAQSNSACDEVGVRLLKYVSACCIYRQYTTSLLNPMKGKTNPLLKVISNLRNDVSEDPSVQEFASFRVVIATLMGTSRLLQLNHEDKIRKFDYIFVDECASSTEPEALVPIMGFGTGIFKVTSNIVILGDHKQLGPVINSEMASQLGLGLSLMERIMTKRRYSLDPVTKVYDSNYVTQLLDNFRSHPAILQFSNVMFYESKLRAKLQEPERSFGTRWEHLPNKKLPMLFDCVKTPSRTIYGGTSTYNEGEVQRVRFYVDLLLKDGVRGEKVIEEDIGIVSPYKAQLNKLTEEFKREADIEVGTSEYYQGREKKIIIISTVKSGEAVGFLKNEKRLNVCITRAKSLLILIGNGDTLQRDPLWNSLLQFLKANNACCGDEFKLGSMSVKQLEILGDLNSVVAEPEPKKPSVVKFTLNDMLHFRKNMKKP